MSYKITCRACGHVINSFSEWFAHGQTCPECGGKHGEVSYDADYSFLKDLPGKKIDNFWHYINVLPLEKSENIVTLGEGAVPIEEWEFLEHYAKEHGIDCKVYAYRNDLNGGTGTLKDVAASLGVSLFKENGVKEYCISSTGNSATAYATYCAKANVKFTNFAPNNICQDSINAIEKVGQRVVVSQGDYGKAKAEAADYAAKNNVLMSFGNFDPIRIEAKKTMVMEFLRQLGKMPDVYMQAVAGGTGPIAVDKGIREIAPYGNYKLPRMVLAQQDLCDPMVRAWEKAKANNFPEGYEKDFQAVDGSKTKVSILNAANPGMYPLVAPIVKRSNGDFVRVAEAELPNYAAEVYRQKHTFIGPAATVCLAGFYQAIKENKIKQGETVVINLGESANRNEAFVQQTKALL
ncbi:MAG: pyridoxal-phosphate dependent enzyme [Bacteroidales bacterium]|nr:pyridoxal-phosphate dependent enzyme [Bacteroidales bacterium]